MYSSEVTYKEQTDRKNIAKMRDVLKELPSFCGIYFRGVENTTSTLTRLNYAYDLRLFMKYLCENDERFSGKSPIDLTLEDMKMVRAVDIEMFLEFSSYYKKGEKEFVNHAQGKARKVSTLRSFFKYLFRHEYIESNVASLIDMPKIYENPIIRLEPNEIAMLLDSVENGERLTETQKRYHRYTRSRDLALLTLFLASGIRISELVGLNISDFDFENTSFRIVRKGGNAAILFFGPEVEQALKEYLVIRRGILARAGHEDALFLSLQKTRLSTRSVQQLVKKYAQAAIPLKKISPHKFRSTYGTMLYKETGDIYLVADVLGHKDVNTTKKHYAAMDESKRRIAATAVKLREDE